MIDFEIGDVIVWASFDGKKPFPINIYKKKGNWIYQTHRETTDEERVKIDVFVKGFIKDMRSLWKQNMTTRLPW